MRTCAVRVLLALAIVTAAACAGGTASPTATGSGDAGTDSPTTGTGGEGTGAVGIQFAGPPVELPADVTSVIADGDGLLAVGMLRNSTIDTCPRGTEGCGRVATNPVVYARSATGELTQTQIDDVSTYVLPEGFGVPQGFRPQAIARGSAGLVVTGTIVAWDQNNFHNTTVRGVLWHSSDGVSWQRIDLREVVGDSVLTVTEVKATDIGFVVIGELGGHDLTDGPSRGIVLTSADGVTWALAAELTMPAAVELRELLIQRDHWLILGVEYVCIHAFSMPGEANLTQDRLWSSDDDGVTWSLIDLAATGVASDEPPLPTTAQCTQAPSVSGEPAPRAWAFSMIGASQGTFVVGSSDGARVAVSNDLLSWKVADLPNGVPTTADGTQAASAQRILTTDDSGPDIVTLSSGAVLQWHSSDNGTTWALLLSTTPIALEGSLVIEADTTGKVLAIDTIADPDVNATERDGAAAILPTSLKSLVYIGEPAN